MESEIVIQCAGEVLRATNQKEQVEQGELTSTKDGQVRSPEKLNISSSVIRLDDETQTNGKQVQFVQVNHSRLNGSLGITGQKMVQMPQGRFISSPDSIALARGCSTEKKHDTQSPLCLTSPTLPSNKTPDKRSSVITSTAGQFITPTKPINHRALKTPRLHSNNTVKARSMFQSPSPLKRYSVPIMSSTLYNPHSSSGHLNSLGDNVLCYHCGNTLSLQRLLEKMNKQHMGVLETGRTIFDLEKLAETGTARKSIFSLEGSGKDGSDSLFKSAFKNDSLFSDTFLTPSTVTKCPKKFSKEKVRQDRARVDSPGSMSDIDHGDLTELFAPIDCQKDEHQSLGLLWSKLDTLDVQDMLQLLESTTDVLYGVGTTKKTKTEIKEHKKADKEQDNSVKEKSPVATPVPKRNLRPRKNQIRV